MSYRRDDFNVDEWYHCYTRSIERSSDMKNIFNDQSDAERFLQALYLANSVHPVRRSDLYKPTHADIMKMDRKEPIVSIGAYCIMPNHFHLLMKERIEGGISKIMHTVGTSFSMYYNLKYNRVGNVFIKPFRSKHVSDDRYFQHVINYIHLNPAGLQESQWKHGIVHDLPKLEKFLTSYRFSSLADYTKDKRTETVILDSDTMTMVNLRDKPLFELLTESAEFYREYERNF